MSEPVPSDILFRPLVLPCGAELKNRIVKAAMSDSLGDGRGDPTRSQIRLYRRWAEGGAAAAIVGEVQGSGAFAEKPGNLVLDDHANTPLFARLAYAGIKAGMPVWLQLGHAGALAHPPIGTPAGPSALDLPGLKCREMSSDEIAALPGAFAATARRAKNAGFGGVELHAAHGFLLSQFLSPLFNRRTDGYGGSIAERMRIVLEVATEVRAAVGPDFPVALKLNATDQLDGGLSTQDAIEVAAALGPDLIDLLDISGGTYFPGAASASDRSGPGAYFRAFAKAVRPRTDVPLMLTGGFKTRAEAVECLLTGDADVVGLARALVLDPDLPRHWTGEEAADPAFPRFTDPPEGGVTAWYTMGLTALAEGAPLPAAQDLDRVIAAYNDRDAVRVESWNNRFFG